MYIQKCKNSILKSMSNFPMWTCQIIQIRIGDNTNLFTLSESAINAIKKPELVQKIVVLKTLSWMLIYLTFAAKYQS